MACRQHIKYSGVTVLCKLGSYYRLDHHRIEVLMYVITSAAMLLHNAPEKRHKHSVFNLQII